MTLDIIKLKCDKGMNGQGILSKSDRTYQTQVELGAVASHDNLKSSLIITWRDDTSLEMTNRWFKVDFDNIDRYPDLDSPIFDLYIKLDDGTYTTDHVLALLRLPILSETNRQPLDSGLIRAGTTLDEESSKEIVDIIAEARNSLYRPPNPSMATSRHPQ